MKKMKTLVLAALLICGVGSTYAQNREKVRLGVEAGMTVNTIKNSYDDADRKVGFDAGLRVEVNFTDNIYLGTGLQYMMKGVKGSGEYWDGEFWDGEYWDGEYWESKVNTGYLQIPIHVGYRYDFNETIGIFGEFGPFLAIGVNGQRKVEYGRHSKDYDVFGDPDEGYAKRFDMGLGLHVGCEIIQHWQVALGYDWGLIDMYKGPGDNRNGSLRLGVAYMF